MRENLPPKDQRSRLALKRGADGRLRPASGETDIGDLWTEQARIRLREDIAFDKKKTEKKRRKGWPFTKKQTQPAAGPVSVPKAAGPDRKEIAVTISVPKVKLPGASLKRLKANIPHLARPTKKQTAVGLAGLAAAAGVVGFMAFNNPQPPATVAQDNSRPETLGAADLPRNQQPEFETALPMGKSIDSLGGWTRISPPDKEPVYAYVDSISGVTINVSQQPLPETFKKNPNELAKLAEQFSAKEKVPAGDVTLYVGTSAKGPQSVILARDDLLILMKSANKLTNDQWAAYVATLQ